MCFVPPADLDGRSLGVFYDLRWELTVRESHNRRRGLTAKRLEDQVVSI
jgi:hypothetical protein